MTRSAGASSADTIHTTVLIELFLVVLWLRCVGVPGVGPKEDVHRS